MKTLIPSLQIVTASILLGLTVFNAKSAVAQNLFSTTITASLDNYSNVNDPMTNFGTSPFVQVGSQGDPAVTQQIGYFNWSLQGLIDDIKAISPTAILGNVDVVVTLTQTNTDINNPNDFDAQGNPIDRNILTPDDSIPRINNFNAYEVTGDWDESQGINPNSSPSRNNTILFNGNIEQGENNYGGIGLNRLVRNLVNNEDSSLSIGLEATDFFDFPDFGFFPVDSFFSHNGNNADVLPQITINYELLEEGFRVEGGPNFKATGRGGGSTNNNGDWEAGVFSTKQVGDQFQDDFSQLQQTNWVWENDEIVDFELSCDPDTGAVTFQLSNGQTTVQTPDFNNNPCEEIDGLKIFANSRTPNSEMEIVVNQVQEIGGILRNTNDFSSLAKQIGPRFVEDQFIFSNATNLGGLGIEGGVELITGTLRMKWGPGGAPQNPRSGSKNQVFLIPLTRLENPNSFSEQSEGIGLETLFLESDDLGLQSFDEDNTNTITLNTTSVPEPHSLAALFFLGTIGMVLKLEKKEDQN